MDHNLLDKLCKLEDKINEENAKRAAISSNEETIEQKNLDTPHLMPATYFFTNTSTSLYMSFHHEEANNFKHYHDFFELIYVCKGTPIGVINDQEIQLQQGNLCIMNPNAVHYFKKYIENIDLILNIVLPKNLFQKSIFQILFQDPVLNSFFIRFQIENNEQSSFLYFQHLDKDIDYLLELLLKEYLDKKQYSHIIIESLLTLIFSFVLRNYKEKSNNCNSSVTEIIDYIYINYQNVSMASIATNFSYHPKYLSSLIHKHTGQTFRNLIVNIKLQNALNYLLYTNYSVEQIVDMIGYKDKSSFYSMFKSVYGMSPARYRKQFS